MSLLPHGVAGPLPPADRVRRPTAVAFWVLLACWTWKLLEPQPVPETLISGLRGVSDLLPLLAAKTLHALGYAVLAWLLWVWLPAGRWRVVAVVLLLLHGVGTEVGQTFVPNRTGKVTDVFIDWAGIAAGAGAARRLEWRALPLE